MSEEETKVPDMPIERREVISYRLWVIGAIILLFLTLHFCYAAEPPHYEIEADIDTANHKITAREKVTFTNPSNKTLDAIYFHIYPHRKYSASEKRFLMRYAAYFKIHPYPEGFQSGDLKMESVEWQGKSLRYIIEGKDQTILKVELPDKLLPGSSITVDLDFSVDIPHAWGRFGWHKNIISLLRWYPLLSVLDKEGWHNYPFYPYHQPYFSEAAMYRLRLRVSKEQVVVYSGIKESEVLNNDGTKIMIIKSEYPLRDFGLTLSPDYKLVSKEFKGIKINSYYLAQDEFFAERALDFATDLMEYYTQKFIPYPYREFNIAPVFLGYSGAQSANLILIDTRLYKLPKFLIRYFDFILAHETGHQWFYNLVGSDEYREMFIDEGINSYFILQYLEHKYGPDAQLMVLPRGLEWLIPNFSFSRAQLDRYNFIVKNGLDRPVRKELSSFQEPSSIFSIAYGKGAKIIEMLKAVLGEDAFKRMFRRYFEEFAFKNISVEDLHRLAEEESGKDLNWFFTGWLDSAVSCDYAVKSVQGNQVILENRGRLNMPAEVKVELENGRVLNYLWDDREKEKELDVGAKIKTVEVDPQKKLLDLDRTNNRRPRQFALRPVALYYPVYEIPVFLKEDAYSIVAGPQITGSDLGIKSSLQKPQDNIFYLSNAYNFGEERIKNILGFRQEHLFGKMLKWGIEGFAYEDTNGRDDQEGFKLYLRKELSPVSYGLFDENDHFSLYLLRNRDFKSALTSGGLEETRNLHYRQQEEVLWGLNLKFGRYGPYPDPETGWKLNVTLENAQHFLGGQNYFWRTSPELSRYFLLAPKQKFAARVKLGLGYPADKGLFQLGGEKGLRGFAYKTINGSQVILLNTEYRLDLKEDLSWQSWENLLGLEKIQAVGFFDVGKSWFKSFSERHFKKDVGLGLRLHFAVLGFLEKVVLRLDVARTINEPEDRTHYWFGLSQAF